MLFKRDRRVKNNPKSKANAAKVTRKAKKLSKEAKIPVIKNGNKATNKARKVTPAAIGFKMRASKGRKCEELGQIFSSLALKKGSAKLTTNTMKS